MGTASRTSAPTVKLTILVVSYNTRDMTIACLDSIRRETRLKDFEVIVVDNASRDGSVAAIEKHAPDVRLLALDDNLGFARANNLGAMHASGEYLLLLNPDTVVLDGAIDKLVSFAEENPDFGIWGGRTHFADGRLNPSSCWRKMSLWSLFCSASGLSVLMPRSSLFNHEAYGGWKRDNCSEVDIVSGCFLLIRAQLWRTLTGFDALFYMYGEEADLCLRAKKLGARPHITPDARIIHHGGASERSRAGKLVKLLAAKMTLVRRHFHPLTRHAGIFLLCLWPLSRNIAFYVTGLLTRHSSLTERSERWREVWRARAAWIRGYGSVGDGLSAPIVGHAAIMAESSTAR